MIGYFRMREDAGRMPGDIDRASGRSFNAAPSVSVRSPEKEWRAFLDQKRLAPSRRDGTDPARNIAIVMPPYAPTPPAGYGGTENVGEQEAIGLKKLGHNVVMYASGDSTTCAHLQPVCGKSLWSDPKGNIRTIPVAELYKHLVEHSGLFDFILLHTDHTTYGLGPQLKAPYAIMLHAPIYDHLIEIYRWHKEKPFISISDAQRKPAPDLNYIATVHHGVKASSSRFDPDASRDRLVYLGRISEKKGTADAIKIAKGANTPLVIAGPVQPWDQKYFDEQVKPLIDGEAVKWIGEVGEEQKSSLFSSAIACLMPSSFDEPFGLARIEAGREGVPSIAWRRGAFPETIEQGKTGFLIQSIEEGVEAVKHCRSLPRGPIIDDYRRNYTTERMAARLMDVIKDQIAKGRSKRHRG